jgi:hypothetical protein
MESESFPSQDKLYRTASETEDRLQHLLTVLHYLGCDGVARGLRPVRILSLFLVQF